MLTGLLEHCRRPIERLNDQLGRGRAGHAEQHACLDHRLHHVEDVGRPTAADRGDRIQMLLCDSEDLAAGTQQTLGLYQMYLVAMRPRAHRSHALVDQSWRVRHDTDDCCADRQSLLQESCGDAGGKTDHERPFWDVAADLGDQTLHVLRLDHQNQGIGGLRGFCVAHQSNAILFGQLLSPFDITASDDQLSGISTRTDQTRE